MGILLASVGYFQQCIYNGYLQRKHMALGNFYVSSFSDMGCKGIPTEMCGTDRKIRPTFAVPFFEGG